MKYLLFVLVLISCKSGLSENDKVVLKYRIQMHNSMTRLEYLRAEMEEEERLRLKYRNYSEDGRKKLVEIGIRGYYNDWNYPYDIKKDTGLTLYEYLKYCEAHNYDPEKYIEFLR